MATNDSTGSLDLTGLTDRVSAENLTAHRLLAALLGLAASLVLVLGPHVSAGTAVALLGSVAGLAATMAAFEAGRWVAGATGR